LENDRRRKKTDQETGLELERGEVTETARKIERARASFLQLSPPPVSLSGNEASAHSGVPLRSSCMYQVINIIKITM
jgi:hypothetical protein